MDTLSQKERILTYLKQGNSLTGLEALRMFGTIRLASRISELIRDGEDIVSQKVNRNGKWVAKYLYIPQDKTA